MKKIEKFFYHIVTHYNPDFYWSKRPKVVSKSDSTNKLIKLIWLFRLKRMEAYNNASFGTYLNHGAIIETQPILPHGLRGIHISSKAYIGKNVTIYQNCTIGVLKSNGGGATCWE